MPRHRLGPVPPRRVLVVCLANQCRSPMAEHLLASKLSRAHADIEVSSAGIEAVPGLPATSASRRAIKRKYGEDFLAGHKASPLTPAVIANSDLVLVMTRGQKALLEHEWTGVIDGIEGKIQTLGEFAGKPSVDVDDPVGGPDALYDACLALLDELTTKAAERLKAPE